MLKSDYVKQNWVWFAYGDTTKSGTKEASKWTNIIVDPDLFLYPKMVKRLYPEAD